MRLLVHQVHLAQGRFRAASNSLEQALSFNFQVGKSPVFLLVKASVEKEEGKLEEALETFEEALRLDILSRTGEHARRQRKGLVQHDQGYRNRITTHSFFAPVPNSIYTTLV